MLQSRVLTLCLLVAVCQIASASQAKTPSIDEQVREHAQIAVETLQAGASGPLDFSEKSLEVIDEILNESSESVDSVSTADKRMLVEVVSSYVLEVARRQYGGEYAWYEDREQPVLVVGEPKYHLALLAYEAVWARFSGDAGANIPFFFQGFSTRVRTTKPGEKTLYYGR